MMGTEYKRTYGLITFILIFSVISCNKWKEPTDVDFHFDIEKVPTIDNRLSFEGGYIDIDYFDFEGDREQGEDVIFSRDYESGLLIPFDANNLVTELDFIIPQGDYKRIDIGFRTFDGADLPSMVVYGKYEYLDGSDVPFRFEFTDAETFKQRAEDESGGNIILDAEQTSQAIIQLDPNHWFQPLPSSYFEEAELTELDGISTIVISKDMNDHIYDLILDRIDESTLILFNY